RVPWKGPPLAYTLDVNCTSNDRTTPSTPSACCTTSLADWMVNRESPSADGQATGVLLHEPKPVNLSGGLPEEGTAGSGLVGENPPSALTSPVGKGLTCPVSHSTRA